MNRYPYQPVRFPAGQFVPGAGLGHLSGPYFQQMVNQSPYLQGGHGGDELQRRPPVVPPPPLTPNYSNPEPYAPEPLFNPKPLPRSGPPRVIPTDPNTGLNQAETDFRAVVDPVIQAGESVLERARDAAGASGGEIGVTVPLPLMDDQGHVQLNPMPKDGKFFDYADNGRVPGGSMRRNPQDYGGTTPRGDAEGTTPPAERTPPLGWLPKADSPTPKPGSARAALWHDAGIMASAPYNMPSISLPPANAASSTPPVTRGAALPPMPKVSIPKAGAASQQAAGNGTLTEMLQKALAKGEGDKDYDRNMALLTAGLGMMAAGGQPGATGLSGIGQGALAGLEDYKGRKKSRADSALKHIDLAMKAQMGDREAAMDLAKLDQGDRELAVEMAKAQDAAAQRREKARLDAAARIASGGMMDFSTAYDQIVEMEQRGAGGADTQTAALPKVTREDLPNLEVGKTYDTPKGRFEYLGEGKFRAVEPRQEARMEAPPAGAPMQGAGLRGMGSTDPYSARLMKSIDERYYGQTP